MNSNFKLLSPRQLAIGFLVVFNLALLTLRMAVTESIGYGFLVWNLILSMVPLLISRLLLHHDTSRARFAILAVMWLLFLPNAPYILTDFLHFRTVRAPIPAWFDLLLLASYSINGLLFALLTLSQMQQALGRRFGRTTAILLITASAMLSGFGIYIGRYERYNSWDVVSDPFGLFQDAAALLTHMPAVGFTLGYGSLLLILHFFFHVELNQSAHARLHARKL